MKSRDQGGVVDERLNIYGVKNLKVAGMELLSLLLPNHKIVMLQ